ncbi:unnamed protein product [Prorocentrum cordatum]|uniref:EF-hand domain-containing protein n=1 Tax=Prorocentrum cordatum TaxID=2364126 RepID=A0ABN9UYS8_9DINO|nr:unnamed protein product [Polarella glacialis]
MMHKLVIGFAVVGERHDPGNVQGREHGRLHHDADLTQQQAGMRHADNMRKLFALADQDGDGRVSREDVEAAINNPSVRSWIAAMELDCEDLDRMFALMDAEQGGVGFITKDLFVYMMARMKGPARNLDVKEILYRTQASDCHNGGVKTQVLTGSTLPFSSDEGCSSSASGHSLAATPALYRQTSAEHCAHGSAGDLERQRERTA